MKKIYDFVEQTLGIDKAAHFFGVAFIALVVTLVATHTNPGFDGWTYGAVGVLGGIVVAVAKEVVDFCNGRPFGIGDIAAGVLGSIMSFLAAGVLL